MPSTRTSRVFLVVAVGVTALIGAAVYAHLLLTNGVGALDVILLVLFTGLLAWVAQGFWTAILGVGDWGLGIGKKQAATSEITPDKNATIRGTNPHHDVPAGASESLIPNPQSPIPAHRTAIVMPIYNEDPRRVMAGVRAMVESLREACEENQPTGDDRSAHYEFDVFLLSDTNDPENWLKEEAAWADLCVEIQGLGIRDWGLASEGQDAGPYWHSRNSNSPHPDQASSPIPNVFYRRRPRNTARKSGNVADFCRRWGKRYAYMIVLDADSLMSGRTLLEMVRRMEANERLGILQAPPVPVGRESLFARIQQFAAAMYSPIFTRGLARWTGPDGNYYGHNAILRTEAFMAHCGLPNLPGRAPLGGEILSHDFVEAAMIRRAGWEVRIAHDLGGSYEEIPTTMLDYAKRDRRWCQGNLQHVAIALSRGMRPISRLHLLMGATAYLASPAWLIFLMLTAVEAWASQTGLWGLKAWNFDRAQTFEALGLFAGVMLMLLLPKAMAYVTVLRDRERLARFGGARQAGISVVIETAFSVLLAPVMMAFHSRFVLETLTGRSVAWVAQRRDEADTTWTQAFFNHRGQLLGGVLGGEAAWMIDPALFYWLSPVIAGLVLAPVLSYVSARRDLGQWCKRIGLFLIPGETDPPDVLQKVQSPSIVQSPESIVQSPESIVSSPKSEVRSPKSGTMGSDLRTMDLFTRAVLDPCFNTLHVSLLRAGADDGFGRGLPSDTGMEALRHKALEVGPGGLSRNEKLAILSHEPTIRWLHGAAWQRWPMAQT